MVQHFSFPYIQGLFILVWWLPTDNTSTFHSNLNTEIGVGPKLKLHLKLDAPKLLRGSTSEKTPSFLS